MTKTKSRIDTSEMPHHRLSVEEAVDQYETAVRPDDPNTLKELLDLPPYFVGPGGEMLPVPPPRAKGQLWHIKDGALVASLHPGQSEAYTATERIIGIIAGAQSGKTSFGPLWLEREIGLRGPGDYLCVSPTVRLSRLKMIPEFLKLFDRALKLGTWHKQDRFFEFDRQKAAVYFENPAFLEEDTRVIFGSAVNPESLESATAKAAWLDEAGQKQFRLESWEAVQRRLILHQGRVLITTTPYNLGWLKLNIYDPWMRGDLNIRVISFPSDTNPAFPKTALDEMRKNMPAWRFALFYLGQFQKPEGLIYGAFKDALRMMSGRGGHVVKDFKIPKHWPRYVGIDFGGNNTATVWIAQNPNTGELFLYRESLEGGKTTSQHAAKWKMLAEHDQVTHIRWVGGAAGEEQFRRDFSSAGIPVIGPPPVDVMRPDGTSRTVLLTSVEVGIMRVLSLFQGMRLFIFESCKGVRAQLGDYGRIIMPDGTPSEQIDQKARYHFMDALRYIGQRLYSANLGMPDIVAVASAVGWQPRLEASAA